MSTRNRYQRLAAPGTMEMGLASGASAKKMAGDVACKSVNKKFWVNERTHRLRKTDLVGLAYLIFLRNPIALSWWLLLIVEAWVLLFVLLEQFGILALPAIDNTVPAIIFGAVTFLSGFILNGGLTRRGNNIRNIKSLISAAVNTMSGIEANIKYSAWLGDPKVKLEINNNAEYVQQSVGVMKCLEQISELIGALLAAQRNVQRGGFDAKKLPLDPWLISEVYERQRRTPQSDPLVTLQTMIWYRIAKLEDAGGLLSKGDKILEKFNGDLVDSLGNVAIDAAASVPQVFQVFYYFFLVLWIIYMPFWLIPLYPDYFVLLAAPLSIVFFAATVELGNRMPDIYVTSSENTYSGYNLIQEIRDGAANVDQIYESVFNKVRDLNAGPSAPIVAPTAATTPATPAAPGATPAAPETGGGAAETPAPASSAFAWSGQSMFGNK